MSKLPCHVMDCIEGAEMALEKGLLVLGDVVTEHSCSEITDGNMRAWVFERGRITKYLDIALDYMCQALKKLEGVKDDKADEDGDPA